MRNALRTTLATVVLAALAMGAHAQAPKDPAQAPKAQRALIAPTPAVVLLQCPEVVQVALHQTVAKLPPPWRPVRSGKNDFAFVEATLTYPHGEGADGDVLTCKYQDVDTMLQAMVPRGCGMQLIGTWSGGAGALGAFRLPHQTTARTCRPTPPGQTTFRPGMCGIDCTRP